MNFKSLHQSIVLVLAVLAIIVLNISCVQPPQTKEDYIKEYQNLIEDISNGSDEFTKEDWSKIRERHERFKGEYFNKFENDFSWKEKLIIVKEELKYKLLMMQDNSSDFLKELIVKDSTKLKEPLKNYTDNEMKEDIEFVLKQAKEIGSTAMKIAEELIKELKDDLEEMDESKKE